MALNAAKVRARVVCTISTPGHFCLFFPDAVMNGDRLSGRYCAVETADHSERAANDRRKTVANPAARHVRTHGPTTKAAFSLRILQPCIGLREIEIGAGL